MMKLLFPKLSPFSVLYISNRIELLLENNFEISSKTQKPVPTLIIMSILIGQEKAEVYEVIHHYLFIFCTYDSYSEEEARQKIYSVSTRCYFAFGALVSEEVSLKIKGGFLFFFSYKLLICLFFVSTDDGDFNILNLCHFRATPSSLGSARFLPGC